MARAIAAWFASCTTRFWNDASSDENNTIAQVEVATMSGWQRRSISLPFRAGEISLAEVAIDAATMTSPYLELSPSIGSRFPRDVLQEFGTKAAVIHSCPIDGTPRPISFSSGGLRYLPAQFPRHHVDVSGEFQDYLKSKFSSKSRSLLMRKVNKVAKQNGGNLDVREYCEASEISTWHRLARGVSSKTYQDKLLKRGLPDTSEFLSEACAQAQRGLFRGYLLFHHGEAIAFLACPITSSGAMIYEFVGHDPAYKALSPGTVLLFAVLKRAFADETIRMFDFTEGGSVHKERFATHKTQCADVWFFAPHAGFFAMVAAHASLQRACGLAVAGLERADLKDSVRRFVRTIGR